MSTMLRLLRPLLRLPVLLGITAMTAVVGTAASLSASTTSLGSGTAATTPACATSGVSMADGYDASGNVNAVTVSGLPTACVGGTASVTVYNGTTFTTATGTVPSSGTVTVSISPVVAFNAGTSTDLAITK